MKRKKGIESPYFKKEQADIIVKLLHGGERSTAVAEMLNISRERVCQIFYKATGESLADYRKKEKLENAKKAMSGILARRKAICEICGGEFIKSYKRKYCSPACQEIARRDNSARDYKEFKAWRKQRVLREIRGN